MRAPSLGWVFWVCSLGHLVVGLVREWWAHALVALIVGGLGFLLGLAVAEAATWGPL